MEVPSNEGDQDKSDQDSDEQDGSDDDNPAPDNGGASNPPTRAARSSISGSSKVHWTLQEDELLREGEAPRCSGLTSFVSHSLFWTVVRLHGTKWTALVPGKTLSQCKRRCTRLNLNVIKGGWTATVLDKSLSRSSTERNVGPS